MRSMRPLVLVLSLTGCGSDSSDADVAALTARVTALETDNEQLQTDLAAALARITALETTQTSTTGTLTTLQGTLIANESAIDNRLDEAETDVAVLQSDLGDLETDVGGLQADVGGLQTDVGGLQADVGDVQASVGAIEATWVTGETTWDVGPSGDYTTLAAAWAAAQDIRLAAGATLTIALGNGTFPVGGALNLNHPDGDRIFLTGTGSATTTVLFPEGGFVLDEQHRLGGIEGLTVDTTAEGTEVSGIWVYDASSTHLTDVVLKDFTWGLRISQGGVVEATSVEAHANDTGVFVETGGVLDAPDLDVQDNIVAIAAYYGGVITADGLDARSDGGLGAYVQYSSVLRAFTSNFTGGVRDVQVGGSSSYVGVDSDYGEHPSGIAIQADEVSYVDVGDSRIQNTDVGIIAEDNSIVDATAITKSGLNTTYSTQDGGLIHNPYDPP